MKYLNDVNYEDCVGKILKSKNSGDFKVLKYLILIVDSHCSLCNNTHMDTNKRSIKYEKHYLNYLTTQQPPIIR